MLPVIKKVAERAFQTQLLAFLKEKKVSTTFQSGLRNYHSTETAIVYLNCGTHGYSADVWNCVY